MRSLSVVMLPPTLDDDPGLGKAVEDLAIEKLVAELGIEALAIAILPRRARLDEGRPGPDSGDPVPDGGGDELRAIV